MESNITVVESQVDWITCSNHNLLASHMLEAHAEALAAHWDATSDQKCQFRLMGFQGWHQGRVRFGRRGNAGLVQISGQLASDHWREVYQLADHVSRIDVQVTARWPFPDCDVGTRLCADAVWRYEQGQLSARPEYHGDGDGGYTFQLGRRSAPWVLRVYNKDAEVQRYHDAALSEQYQNCWRFEVEAKASAASKVAEALADAPDQAQASRALVAAHLQRHGLDVPFPAEGTIVLTRTMHRASDRLSKLAWMDRQVRPAVQWLMSQGGSSDVYQALGMTTGDAVPPDGYEEP